MARGNHKEEPRVDRKYIALVFNSPSWRVLEGFYLMLHGLKTLEPNTSQLGISSAAPHFPLFTGKQVQQ